MKFVLFFRSVILTYINDRTRFQVDAEERKKNDEIKQFLLAFILSTYMHFVQFLSKSIWSLKSTLLNRRRTKERKVKSKISVHYSFVLIKYLFDWFSIEPMDIY
jgi:hypothetical protein